MGEFSHLRANPYDSGARLQGGPTNPRGAGIQDWMEPGLDTVFSLKPYIWVNTAFVGASQGCQELRSDDVWLLWPPGSPSSTRCDLLWLFPP
jgi:hypothetical protein